MGKKLRDISGVILAAGRGTRMAPFSSKYPKPVLPVLNRPLMEYQIELMRKAGIYKIFVVIGHLGYEIAREIGSGKHLGVEITYVEQSDVLGIAHALCQLESYVATPFMLFLGDIYFHPVGMEDIVTRFRAETCGSYLFVKEEDNPEAIKRNFSVHFDESTGLVKRVIEKPRHVRNRLKGCGLYLFDLPVFDAVRRTPRTAMRNEYEITDAVQILIDDGEPVRVSNCIETDVNLTNPKDLLFCNLYELSRRKLDNFIDPSAIIDGKAEIINSVIGPDVTIEGHITVKNSLIMKNTLVSMREGLINNHIITGKTSIDCSINLNAG